MKWLLLICVSTLGVHAAPVTALQFSPDGKDLLINRPRAIEVRAVKGDSNARKIACDFQKVTAFAFAPDGKALAVAGGTPGELGGVHLLDWPSGKLRGKWNVFEDVATCVAFNGNGHLIAGSAGNALALLDLRREGRTVRWFDSHTKAVRGVAFMRGGKQFVSVGADGTVKLWTLETNRLERTLAHHQGPVHAVAVQPFFGRFSLPELTVCATASDDRTVRMWQPLRGRMLRIVRGSKTVVHAVAFTVDGKRIISVGRDGIGRVIDAGSDRVLHQWKAHADWAYALAVGRGNEIATGDWSGEVKLWQLKGDQVVKVE